MSPTTYFCCCEHCQEDRLNPLVETDGEMVTVESGLKEARYLRRAGWVLIRGAAYHPDHVPKRNE